MTDKRTQIENEAISAIKRSGLGSVSFRTLADAVGVKSASVHYHFPTKADLAQSVVRRYTEDFEARLREIRSGSADLGERLQHFAALFEPGAEARELCLCGMLAAEVENLDAGTRSALGSFFSSAERWLVEIFEDARDADSALPPEALARLVMAGLEGASMIDRVRREGEHLDAWRAFLRTLTSSRS